MMSGNQRAVCGLVFMGIMSGCQGPAPDSDASGSRMDFLTPAIASVAEGETVAFRLEPRTNGGTEIDQGLAYSAGGGTITNTGLYSAGTVPGIYPVIATLEGPTLADTSVVMVVRPDAHIYATDFLRTEKPISEEGRWIGGGTVGLDWTDVSTAEGRAVGNQVGASYTDATAILEGPWAADQMVSATVYASGAPRVVCHPEVELRLRSAITPHSNTGYEIAFKVLRHLAGIPDHRAVERTPRATSPT